MATNPMQRQARVSFLLGMIISLLITGVIIIFLFMQMKKINNDLKEEQSTNTQVFVLTQDVKSGQVITAGMFTLANVKTSGVPADATSNITNLLNTYALCDKSGNHIYTKYKEDGTVDYMYIPKSSQTREEATNSTNQSGNQNTTNSTNNTSNTSSNDEIKVYKDDKTNTFYTLSSNGAKETLETVQKPLIAKVDLKANTVITGSVIARSDELVTDDLRQQEYNVMSLPIDLVTDDYVDIRIMLPSGTDFIVVSKKKVTVPIVNGAYLPDTIQMNLTEDETLLISNAIVEASQIDGAKLYVTKYIEAGLQENATPTYVANGAITDLIIGNPNVVNEAKASLRSRYTEAMVKMRNDEINGEITKHGKDENVSQKMDESVTSTQESRKQYLQSLPVGGSTGATSTTGASAGTGAATGGAATSGTAASGGATK